MPFVLLAACLCLSIALQPVQAQTDEDLPRVTKTYALVNVRIVQAPGRVVEKGTVVVQDGLITAVGTEVDVPYNAERITGDSLTVYAGFIDGLSYAGIPKSNDNKNNQNEVENPGQPPNERAGIQPQRKAHTQLDPKDETLKKLRRLGFAAAHVVPRKGMLAGTGAIALLSGQGADEMVLQEETGLVARFDTERGIYPATDMAVLAKLRQLYGEAQRRKKMAEVYAERPEGHKRPAYSPEHYAFFPVLEGKRPLFFQAEQAVEVHRVLSLQEELGFPLVLTGLREGFRVVETLKDKKRPLFLSLDLPKKPKYPKASEDSTSAKDVSADSAAAAYNYDFRAQSHKAVALETKNLKARQALERQRYYAAAARMQKAGLVFGFTTAGTKPAHVWENLQTMVQHGLPEQAALAALTTNAAQMLGVSKSLGTVEGGKIANLVVTNGSLFQQETAVRYVFVDGRKFTYESEASPEPKDTAKQKEKQPEAPQAKPWSPPGQQQGDLLVQNGTVITVTNGMLKETDILVRDGKIAAIGKDITMPDGIKTIDASGMYVMPGIVDAHSHIAIDDINEYTNPVTSEVRVGDVIDPYDINLYRALAGGVTVSHVMHGSANVIGGQNETIKHRYGVLDPEGLKMNGAPGTIKFALGENPTRVHGEGHDVMPSSRMGVEFVVRKAFRQAQRYRAAWNRYEKERKHNENAVPPPYNERLEVIADILEGKIKVHCHSYRADEILMLMNVLEEFGVENVTFQHVNEGFKIAPELAEFGAGASVFSDWWAYKFEVYYSTAYNAAVLTENGVLTSINSDSPELNRHLYHEAAKSQRYGALSNQQALKLITINPARQLGIADRVGSIEEGKDADLAIFNAHPLSIYAIPQKTVVDGVVRFDRKNDPDDVRLRVDPETPVRTATTWQNKGQHRCMWGVDFLKFMRSAGQQ